MKKTVLVLVVLILLIAGVYIYVAKTMIDSPVDEDASPSQATAPTVSKTITPLVATKKVEVVAPLPVLKSTPVQQTITHTPALVPAQVASPIAATQPILAGKPISLKLSPVPFQIR